MRELGGWEEQLTVALSYSSDDEVIRRRGLGWFNGILLFFFSPSWFDNLREPVVRCDTAPGMKRRCNPFATAGTRAGLARGMHAGTH